MTTSESHKSSNRLPAIALGLLIGLGVYWFMGDTRKTESPVATTAAGPGVTKALAKGTLAGFIIHNQRKDIPVLEFADASGVAKNLGQWKGRTVMLNLWATWCAPCRKEMPDLAKLQKQLGGADFEVVALSLDRKGAEASTAFLKETGADNLITYVEPAGKSLAALQALGLPATMLIDRQGKEVGRLLGPADWSAPEVIELVKAVLAEK